MFAVVATIPHAVRLPASTANDRAAWKSVAIAVAVAAAVTLLRVCT
jgi:hypothetical protein